VTTSERCDDCGKREATCIWLASSGGGGTLSLCEPCRNERQRQVDCRCKRVPVLCQCGWGILATPECEVPEFCPLCGFPFWEAFGPPPPCGEKEGVTS
jgi:hypothetical protein